MRSTAKRCLIILFALSAFAVSSGSSGLVQEVKAQNPPQEVLDENTYSGIPYLSGGVGMGERDDLRERLSRDYNLKLVFAIEEGNYLADVGVVIKNSEGNVLMEATSKGPWFFTKLPEGDYQVTATSEGKSLEKSVHVDTTGQKEVAFYWK